MSRKLGDTPKIMGGEAFFAALLAAAKGDKEKTYRILRKLADEILNTYDEKGAEE